MVIKVDKATNEEAQNICNMPLIAEIELHRSDETGKYYLNFITWLDDDNHFVSGLWCESKPLPEETIRKLEDILYTTELSKTTKGEIESYRNMVGTFRKMMEQKKHDSQ